MGSDIEDMDSESYSAYQRSKKRRLNEAAGPDAMVGQSQRVEDSRSYGRSP